MEEALEKLAESQVEFAGFWVRLLATLVDTMLLTVFVTLPLTLIYGPQDYFLGEQIFLGFWDVVLGYIMPVLLTIWFWIRFLGTPGKLLLNLQVVDAKSMIALTVWQAIGRYLGYFVSILVFFMGFFWIAFDRRKQGLHDKLAGTLVIKKQAAVACEQENRAD
jgi:uncharacterized RDD family membrane protein YckC